MNMKKYRLKRKFKIIFLFVMIVVLCGFLFMYNSEELSIELVADAVTIKLDDEYSEPGYKALDNGIDITDKVIVSNNINNKRIGDYKVNYKVDGKFKSLTKKRDVKVIDDISPTITLNGGSTVSINVNDKYSDLGYTASDNYDGDITKKVKVTNTIDNTKVGVYDVIYDVSDTSGNSVEVKRLVNVGDKTNTYKLPVLMYHFFYDSTKGEVGADNNFMDTVKLAEQLKYLTDNNYYFPSWNEVNDYLDGNIALPSKSVVITVDDGASSFFSLAYPLFKKYNVRVTSFIVTSWTTPSDIYDSNILYYGSHSNNMHRGGCKGGHGGIFQCLDSDKALDDLKTSKSIANDTIVFCYPFGDVTDNEKALVKEAGYQMAFTTVGGRISPKMDKYDLPRVRMSGGISLSSFIKAVE